MKTSEFLTLIATADEKPVRFTTQTGVHVPTGYHITEIMNVQVNSVDCGGRPSSYSRTVVQLWNGSGEFAGNDSDYLHADKVKAIFDRVGSVQTLLLDDEIFFEWGDASTPTSTYAVSAYDDGQLYVDVKLFVPATQCKPAADLDFECCAKPSGVEQVATACCG